MKNNPTTANGQSRAEERPVFRIEIIYDPATGDLRLSGPVSDPLLFYGMLRLAERAYERASAKKADAETSRIHKPTLVGE